VAGTFDFAPGKHSAQEVPPEEPSVTSFNGWEFTARPGIPYRRKFRLKLAGLVWYLDSSGTTLDISTDPTMNAGRLLEFYKLNRTWDTFTYPHEYLGDLTCRFAHPVEIPLAIPNSFGRVPEFELMLIHHNPGY
jgi:hypothetical protein